MYRIMLIEDDQMIAFAMKQKVFGTGVASRKDGTNYKV